MKTEPSKTRVGDNRVQASFGCHLDKEMGRAAYAKENLPELHKSGGDFYCGGRPFLGNYCLGCADYIGNRLLKESKIIDISTGLPIDPDKPARAA